MKAIINTHVTKEIQEILSDHTPACIEDMRLHAIMQITVAVRIINSYVERRDMVSEIDPIEHINNDPNAKFTVIDIKEFFKSTEDILSTMNYINIEGRYVEIKKLLLVNGGEQVCLLVDEKDINFIHFDYAGIDSVDAQFSSEDYAAINILQLDLFSAWRVLQLVTTEAIDCTAYWAIPEIN
ncbi:MAG: hypothetical protein ACI36Z_00440 [Alloprevotella sp.]